MSPEQKAFNKAYRGLASQGFERSTAPTDGNHDQCLYRGPGGRKCAAGWLIPDRKYKPEMEASGIVTYVLDEGLYDFDGLDGRFLLTLQRAHDNGLSPRSMKQRLAEFATEFGLTVPRLRSPEQGVS